MSFFGYLAAGAAEGVGKSMVDEANYADKLAAQRQLMQEKQAGALDMQRERALDRRDNLMFQAEMRKGNGGGGGRGSFNLYQEQLDANTPERQDRIAAMTKATTGSQDASDALMEAYGRPRMAMTNPTTGDVARFDRQAAEDGSNPAAAPQSGMQAASFDRQKGSLALGRLMAVAMDPAKLKPYADGEAQLLRNDVTTNVTLPGALRSGDRSVENVNEALSTLDPKAINQTGKNSTFAERTAIMQDKEAGIASRAAVGEGGRNYRAELKAAETAYTKALEIAADSAGSQKDAARKTAEEAKLYRDKIRSKAQASEAAASAPDAPTARPRTAAQASAAYKAGQGY